MLKSPLWILFALISQLAFSQSTNPYFSRLTTDQGLSNNTVYAITQDKKGFMWFGTEQGLNRFDGYKFEIYEHNKDDPSSLRSHIITALYSDQKDNVWVGTFGGGLNFVLADGSVGSLYNSNSILKLTIRDILEIYPDSKGNVWIGTNDGPVYFDAEKSQFIPLDLPNEYSGKNKISGFYEHPSGNIWMSSRNGIIVYNPSDGKFNSPYFNNFPSNASIHSFERDLNGDLWIGTRGKGIYKYSVESNDIQAVALKKPITSNSSAYSVFSLFQDSKGYMWIGTLKNELYRYNVITGELVYYGSDSKDPNSLSSISIWSIFEDDSGLLWIGTYGGGINRYDPNVEKFIQINDQTGLSGNRVTSVIEGTNNRLIAGISGSGLNCFGVDDIYSDRIIDVKIINQESKLSGNYVSTLFMDSSDQVWAGTWGAGLNIISTEGVEAQITSFTNVIGDSTSLGCDHILSLFQDSQGSIWVGTWEAGLQRVVQNDNGKLTFNSDAMSASIPSRSVYSIQEDADNNLWVGTSRGLLVKTRNSSHLSPYLDEEYDLTDNFINCLLVDSKNNLWIGTKNCLNVKYNGSGHIIPFTSRGILINSEIRGIVEDRDNNIWISSNRGILKIDITTNHVRNYGAEDGLINNQFARTGFYSNSGHVVFAGNMGITMFKPGNLSTKLKVPPVIITSFSIDSRFSSGDSSPWNMSLDRPLELGFDQNTFTLEFAALSFRNPSKNRYMYKLEGLENQWVNAGNRRFVTYANIPPGEYKFIVKGSDDNGIWNETGDSLSIVISPALWATKWAYSLYTFLVAVAVLFIFNILRNKDKLKHALELEKLEAQKAIELDHVKTKFFTHVSHEFRTPLSLILGPVKALQKKDFEGDHDEYLDIIARNATHLKLLTDQIMDISKLEFDGMELQIDKHDVKEFINGICSLFKSVLGNKTLKLAFDRSINKTDTYFDKAKMESIMYNLLSNAVKFTGENGNIEVCIKLKENKVKEDGKILVINVLDDGKGIRQKHWDKIFNRFYQVNEKKNTAKGTGIGLAGVKELIRLHKGSVEMISEYGKFTEFTISIPIEKYVWIEEIRNSEEATHHPEKGPSDDIEIVNPNQHIILAVDDNPDILKFIHDLLCNEFIVHLALNASEGYEIATQLIPDLIISDIMMPGIDGHAFCDKIKKDPNTDHIPFILLTAKAEGPEKIKGLQKGVDDYIVKPFEPEELRVRVTNLINQRNALREKYQKSVILEPSGIVIDSFEERFLKNTISVLESNLDNSSFGTSELSNELGMSRMQLHRKLKALTGLSTNEFIHTIKLKRAIDLLTGGFGNVADVAYAVGFSSPSYFTECFKKFTGKLPSEYLNNGKVNV